ncbi:MAG: hypothetical protein KGH54_03095 [Candidatus Micrarchaeota archaeon]|nr:hypothetical protein [Candidatus Micrarchaeota archaeon]
MPTTNSISKIYDSAIQANVTGNKLAVVKNDEFSFGKMHTELLRTPMSIISEPKEEIGSFLQDLIGASRGSQTKISRGKITRTDISLDNVETYITTTKKALRQTPTEPGIFPGVKSSATVRKEINEALAHDIEYTEAEMYVMDAIKNARNFTTEAVDLIVNVASHMRKFAVVEFERIALEMKLPGVASKFHKLHASMNKGSK